MKVYSFDSVLNLKFKARMQFRIIIDILYELVLLHINHQFIDHHWLILLDRLWTYSPLMSTNGVFIHNHIIHDITFNPPNTSWILGILSNQGVAKMHVIYVCIFVTNGFLLILNCSWEIKAFLISSLLFRETKFMFQALHNIQR